MFIPPFSIAKSAYVYTLPWNTKNISICCDTDNPKYVFVGFLLMQADDEEPEE